jgi:D-alanyl-D-alanine carboxypeptidase/D-alanyl-D-alanine-endopeptidase (penicillin-binding protein 4)
LAKGISAVLSRVLADPALGPSIGVSVLDGETGQVLVGTRDSERFGPASTAKLITAAAILASAGPSKRLVTRVVSGIDPGDIVLIGGGDPTLAAGAVAAYPGAASLVELAEQVKRSRMAAGAVPVRRVILDTSLFVGATTGPGWDSDIVSAGFASPVTSLMTDGGRPDPRSRTRGTTPDLTTGRAFARMFGPSVTTAPGVAWEGATNLGRVFSPPLGSMVEMMLTQSDNVLAEVLSRQVAIAANEPASFAGTAEATRAVLAKLGLDVTGEKLLDSSGLSRLDQLTPKLLTAVLAAASGDRHPELRPILTGLPVAAYSGTLADRFGSSPARSGVGVVRAKTGTLSGVSALAGILLDADGRRLIFALTADQVPAGGTGRAEAVLDRAAALLASCGCR